MKIAVIKLSGKSIETLVRDPAWLEVIAHTVSQYEGVTVVHGGGREITNWSQALGHSAEFYEGQRVTTPALADIVAAVQSGLLNGKIVSFLVANGFEAVGLSGYDRGLLATVPGDAPLGRVGIPYLKGSTAWLCDLMENNVIPVFSSLCTDDAGQFMNVNADLFTATLAVALQAESVYMLSDIPGVLVGGHVAKTLSSETIERAFSSGDIRGGMIPKIHSCVGMIAGGVSKIWIGPSDAEALLGAMTAQNPRGTFVIKEKDPVYG
jgi:acetylglutamate kinase